MSESLDFSDPITTPGRSWDWVLAAPFRAQVRQLLAETGISWRTLAGFADVPDEVIRRLSGPRGQCPKRIAPAYARRLIMITPANLRAGLRAPVPPERAQWSWQVLSDHQVPGLGPCPGTIAGQPVTLGDELRLRAKCRAYGLTPVIETPGSGSEHCQPAA